MRNQILAVTILLTAVPALADPQPAKPKPAKGSPEEIVCHREAVTGSLVQGRRTCMTRAQRQAQAEAAQAAADGVDEHARINSEAGR